MVRVDDDAEIPESGAVFTFGRSKFADNVPSKFWIRNDSIASIACGDEHSVIVTGNGRVYVFGNNGWGQLGLGNTKNVSKPSCLKVLKHEKARGAAGGRSHSLVSTESGKVYAFGANGDGQLGLGDNLDRSEPTLVLGIDGVVAVAAGSYHSAVLTANGKLFVFGSNSEGQLGLEDVKTSSTPVELPLGISIKEVACGYYHTVVIGDGKLYTFGEKEGGKLGLQDKQLQKGTNRPQCVFSITEKLVAASCGGSHTAAVTECGKLYTFGSGPNGQLGLGTLMMEAASPSLVVIPEGRPVARVSCGESHTAVITQDGHLFTCGDGRHGKLALGNENFSNQFGPALVKRFSGFRVHQVASGGCHMIVLASKSVVADIGAGDSGGDKILNEATNVDELPNGDGGLSARNRRRRREQDSNPESDLNRALPPLPIADDLSLPPKAFAAENKLDELKLLEQHILEMEELDKNQNGASTDFDAESVFSDISQFNKTHELTTLDGDRASLLLPVKPATRESPSKSSINDTTTDTVLEAKIQLPTAAPRTLPSVDPPKDALVRSPPSDGKSAESKTKSKSSSEESECSGSSGSEEEEEEEVDAKKQGSAKTEVDKTLSTDALRKDVPELAKEIANSAVEKTDDNSLAERLTETVVPSDGKPSGTDVGAASPEVTSEGKIPKKESFMKRLFSFKKNRNAKSSDKTKTSVDAGAEENDKNLEKVDSVLSKENEQLEDETKTAVVETESDTNGDQKSREVSARPSSKNTKSTSKPQNSKACILL